MVRRVIDAEPVNLPQALHGTASRGASCPTTTEHRTIAVTVSKGAL